MRPKAKILQKPKENRCFCKAGLRGSDAKKRRFRTSFWDPKRVENRSKRMSENGWKINRLLDTIFVDFGAILAPKTDPKIVQKSSKIALLSHFGRSPELRRLQGTNLDVSGSIRERFWRDFRSESHSRARFSAVPPAESRSRARFGHFRASKSAKTRA